MKQSIALIGVPTSAGAHWPGQEKAPQYLRNAGLVARLEAAGLEVIDCEDLPLVRFRPDKEQRQQQNLTAVVEVARRVADQVDMALRRNAIPLVIGGDCTIGLGVIAGFLRHDEDLGLLYFDGHTDLNTPATSPSGILDSMGMAHIIGESGHSFLCCLRIRSFCSATTLARSTPPNKKYSHAADCGITHSLTDKAERLRLPPKRSNIWNGE